MCHLTPSGGPLRSCFCPREARPADGHVSRDAKAAGGQLQPFVGQHGADSIGVRRDLADLVALIENDTPVSASTAFWPEREVRPVQL